VPGYVYATKGDVLYVNMFVAGEAKVELGGKAVAVRQETRYPWDGAVGIAIEPEKAGEFAVHIRVPGWAQGRPVPTDLYRYEEGAKDAVSLRINGAPVPLEMDQGFARVRRDWRSGDRIEIVFPMEARRVVAHPSVRDDEGFVAVERGPLVYCAEGPDNGGRALNIVLRDGATLRPEARPDLLGGVVALIGEALVAEPSAVSRVQDAEPKDAAADDEEEAPPASRRRLAPGAAFKPHPLVLIPYYAWAHRGPAEMSVWLLKTGTQYSFPNSL
jgi:DUF1680 family protein